MKVVKSNIWKNPQYLKSNEREHMEAFICKYPDVCPKYQKGECVCETLFLSMIKCPHSEFIRDTGLTKKAKNFGVKSSKWEKDYATDIKTDNKILCQCGDYIYLPYVYLEVLTDKISSLLVNKYFIPIESFNSDFIKQMLEWKPYALIGGEITSFQEKELPKFIQQLHDVFPEKYDEFLLEYPEYKEKFDVISKNYVGRKAYLSTLKDGASFPDCHGNMWIKKTNSIVCENMDTMICMPFGQKPRKVVHEITDDMIVKIRSNDDVLESTVFVD